MAPGATTTGPRMRSSPSASSSHGRTGNAGLPFGRPLGHTPAVPWPPPVPWLFLAVAAIGVLFTLNALSPVKRSWLLQAPGFFASWLTGELAPHHLFWQALATLAFVW